jgi:hypothetical protein
MGNNLINPHYFSNNFKIITKSNNITALCNNLYPIIW